MRRTWRTRGNYMWTTKRPFALWSIPLPYMLLLAVPCSGVMLYSGARWWSLFPLLLLKCTGRHIAYVGQTGSRLHRDADHIFGRPSRGILPKPWSDLKPRAYALPSFPWWKRSRELTEKGWIKLLRPVYNVQHNMKNRRRIKPWIAKTQRSMRDDARRARKSWLE
jgi:hypothetical protein